MRGPRHKLLMLVTSPLLAAVLAAVVFGVVIGCGGHGGDGGYGDLIIRDAGPEFGPPPGPAGAESAPPVKWARQAGGVTGTPTAGWNFFALPYEPDDESEVTGIGHCEAWRWEPGLNQYRHIEWIETGPDLLKLPVGVACWVRLEAQGSVSIQGANFRASAPVLPGWNGICLPGHDDAQLQDLRVWRPGAAAYEPLLSSSAIQLPVYGYHHIDEEYVPLDSPTDELPFAMAMWVYCLEEAEIAGGQAGLSTPLAVTPTSATVGDPAVPLTFSIGVDPSVGTPDSLELMGLDADGNLGVTFGSFVDNGDPANGDDVAGDGMYHCVAELTPSVPALERFRAAMTYDPGSGEQTALSNAAEVLVLAPMTEQRAQEILDQGADVRDALDDLAEQMSPESAAEQVAADLSADPGVTEADVMFTPVGVHWTTYEGLTCVAPLGEEGMTSGTAAIPRARATGHSVTPVLPLQSPIRSSAPKMAAASNNTVVGNNKALFLSPFHSTYGWRWGDEVVDTYHRMQTITSPDFQEDLRADAQCDVEAFKQMDDYGLVAISTHGVHIEGFGTMLVTGEFADPLSALLHWEDIVLRRIVAEFPRDLGGEGVWAITPYFVRHYCQGMPRSIVYASACYSLYRYGLASAFIDCGARAYYGYTDNVHGTFTYLQGNRLFSKDPASGLLGGANTLEALLPLRLQIDRRGGRGAQLTMHGSGWMVLLPTDCHAPDQFEDNDAEGTAKLLLGTGPGTLTANGLTVQERDPDYYKVAVPDRGRFKVRLEFDGDIGASPWVWVVLDGPRGPTERRDGDTVEFERYNTTGTDQEYVLGLTVPVSGCRNYDMTVEVTPPGCQQVRITGAPGTFEPGDTVTISFEAESDAPADYVRPQYKRPGESTWTLGPDYAYPHSDCQTVSYAFDINTSGFECNPLTVRAVMRVSGEDYYSDQRTINCGTCSGRGTSLTDPPSDFQAGDTLTINYQAWSATPADYVRLEYQYLGGSEDDTWHEMPDRAYPHADCRVVSYTDYIPTVSTACISCWIKVRAVISVNGQRYWPSTHQITCNTDCAEDAYEQNDTEAEAKTVQGGTYSNLTAYRVCGSPDHDWYAVDVPPNKHLKIQITYEAGKGGLQLTAHGTTADPDDDGYVEQVTGRDPTAWRQWKVDVQVYPGNLHYPTVCIPYSMTLSFMDPP